jgi:carbonic anhydrase
MIHHHVICLLLIWMCALGLNAQQTATVSSADALLNETLKLARGHQEFRNLDFKQNEAEFVRLAKEGQNPQTLFIACSDSRVVPEIILSSRPGDLFVIRTAGNFVPPYHFQSMDGVMATIQYAVEVLNVRHIIVCGHSHCGAIKGLFQDIDPEKLGILSRWIRLGEDAKRVTLLTANPSTPREDLYTTAEELSVLFQLEHLMTYPFVRKRVCDKTIELHGWYFKIEKGEVSYYNIEKNQYVPLAEKIYSSSSS